MKKLSVGVFLAVLLIIVSSKIPIFGKVKGAIINKIAPPTPTPTPSPSPTATPPSPTATPTSTPTPTRTPTPTPKPTSTPTPTPIPAGLLDDLFTKYSQANSVDRDLLVRIAKCESNLNPNAKNGTYGGLFQFSASSWRSTRRRMNHDDNPDLRFNPEEAIKTASFKIATNGIGSWPNCSN